MRVAGPIVWEQIGLNNDLPKSKAIFGDYEAEVYNAYGDGLWCMLVNKSGERNFASEEAAKTRAETVIRESIARRLAEASRVQALFGDTELIGKEEIATEAVRMAVQIVRELGPSMSPGALAETLERNIETTSKRILAKIEAKIG